MLQEVRRGVIAELGEGEAAETEIELLYQQSETRLDELEARLALLKEHMANLGCDCEALERAVYEKLCGETATTATFRDAGRVAAPHATDGAGPADDAFTDAHEYTEDVASMSEMARTAKSAADHALAQREAAQLSKAREDWGRNGGGSHLTLTTFRQRTGGAGGCVPLRHDHRVQPFKSWCVRLHSLLC